MNNLPDKQIFPAGDKDLVKELESRGIGKNDGFYLVCAPTGTGKTKFALDFLIDGAKNGEWGILAVPFKAMANEFTLSLRRMIEGHPGVQIVNQTGDYPSLPVGSAQKNVIMPCTYEKLDSFFRQGNEVLSKFKRIVIDEIHSLGETGRGPRLESMITRLKEFYKDKSVKVLFLSATVGNVAEFGNFLGDSDPSDFRDVRRSTITVELKDEWEEGTVISQKLKENKFVLSFKPTRRDAERKALEFCHSSASQVIGIDDLLKAGIDPEEVPDNLKRLLANGVSYHHAGLSHPLREFIEKNNREGSIRYVAATSTLSAGVNMNADVVVICPPLRFKGNFQMAVLSSSEVLQMIGRAGRKKGDNAEAYILCKKEQFKDQVWGDVYNNIPNPVESNILEKEALEEHYLAWVNFKGKLPIEKKEEPLKITFNGPEKVDQIDAEGLISELVAQGFIAADNEIKLKPWGQCYLKLFLEPEIAEEIRDFLRVCFSKKPYDFDLGIILEKVIELAKRNFGHQKIFYGHFDLWINENKEYIKQVCSNAFGFSMGDFNALRDMSVRVLQAFIEVAGYIFDFEGFEADEGFINRLRELRDRVNYGVKADLFPLMVLNFPEISRKKARELHDKGIKSLSGLAGLQSSSHETDGRFIKMIEKSGKLIRQIGEVSLIKDKNEKDEAMNRLSLEYSISPEHWGLIVMK